MSALSDFAWCALRRTAAAGRVRPGLPVVVVIGLLTLWLVPAPASAAPGPIMPSAPDAASSLTLNTGSPNPSTYGQSVTWGYLVAGDAGCNPLAGGTVSLHEGATTLATVAVGSAIVYSGLSVGSHDLYATFTGNAGCDPATSNTVGQTVVKGSTTTTLTTSVNPSRFGQSVTFTAQVTTGFGGGSVPSGSVSFDDGATVLAVRSLDGTGSATFTTTTLDVGTHPIRAVYHGNSNYSGSNSTGIDQVVIKTDTSISLTRSTNVAFPANPSKYGQIVIFTANLTANAPGSGTPTGFVLFKSDGATIGVGFIDGTGEASLATGALSVGAHTITAVYGGDAGYNGVTSSDLSHTVEKAVTTTTIETLVSPSGACGSGGADNNSCFGQSVVISATVHVQAPGVGVPTGSITFKDGGTAVATVPLDLDGRAQWTTDELSVATHALTAEYGGSQNQATSTSATYNHRVWKANTTLFLNPGPATSPVFGESFQLTADLSVVSPGAGMPTGEVRFDFTGPVNKSYTVSLGGGGTASMTYTPVDPSDPNLPPVLVPGNYTVTAVYLGDDNFNVSPTSNSRSITVNKSPVSITMASSANPSVFGQIVTFSAIVSPASPGSGTPTGTITFKSDAVTMTCSSGPNPATLDSQSRADCSLTSLSVGTHVITAEYSGDSHFQSFTETLSPDQVVNKVPTQTSLSSSVNPSVFGQSVTFSANVKILNPGTGIPTGSVEFKDGATTLATVPLDGAGNASHTTSALTVGSHSISANYLGTTNIEVSDVAITQTVNKAATTTTLSPPTGTTFNVGAVANFTANVTVNAPGGGVLGGNVKFQRAGVDIAGCGSVALVAGSASCATSTLPVGTHPIRAIYLGTGDHNGSQSAVQFYEVLGAASTTTVTGVPNPSVYGQPVSFTASVSGSSGTPTGTVIFKADGVNFGSSPLSGGTATFVTAGLPVGTIAITALYTGDATYNQSLSPAFNQVVNKASTTTALSSSVNPSVFGQSVTFTAMVSPVAPGAGTPTGTVVFKDGVTSIGTGTLNAAGKATLTTSNLSVAAHSITAEYSGDANFALSTSGALIQVVNKANTTTSLTGTPNPSIIGDPVTFVATVAPVAPGGGVPTGSVSFTADAVPIPGCTAVVLAAGQATCVTSALTLGAHSIVATYSGSTDHNASVSPTLIQTVSDTPVDLEVVSYGSPNPVRAGDSLTLTVTITNHSTSVGVNATLDDVLPLETTFLSVAPPGGWSCTTPSVGSTGTVSCSGFVGASATAVFQIVVHVPLDTPAGTLLMNEATVVGSQPDPNPGNNTSNDETSVYRTRRP